MLSNFNFVYLNIFYYSLTLNLLIFAKKNVAKNQIKTKKNEMGDCK